MNLPNTPTVLRGIWHLILQALESIIYMLINFEQENLTSNLTSKLDKGLHKLTCDSYPGCPSTVSSLCQIRHALTSFREWSVPDSGSLQTI